MPSFLVDENLPGGLVEALASRGLSAEHVGDNPELRGSHDDELMEYAQRGSLTIVSKDKDFADVTRYPLGSHHGVVCVRLPNRMRIDEQVRLVVAAIESLDAREIAGSIVTVEAGRVRVRKRK
jgi:predicted nuclease of predicted toxin-antitoxin system